MEQRGCYNRIRTITREKNLEAKQNLMQLQPAVNEY